MRKKPWLRFDIKQTCCIKTNVIDIDLARNFFTWQNFQLNVLLEYNFSQHAESLK